MSGSDASITGVIAALPAEARCLPTGPSQQRAGTPPLRVRVSGIGGERAEQAARELLQAGAGALLCFGVGGALDPGLRCGDIVLATEVLSGGQSAAPARTETAPDWRRGLAQRLLGLGNVHLGALLSSDELVDSIERKQQLFRQSGAIAVDMESAAVARVAQQQQVPFMVLRVIADTAQDALPRALQAALGDAAFPRGARFWWSLLSAPSGWAALARLGRRYRRARAVLAGCGGAGVSWAQCSGRVRSR